MLEQACLLLRRTSTVQISECVEHLALKNTGLIMILLSVQTSYRFDRSLKRPSLATFKSALKHTEAASGTRGLIVTYH